MDAEVVVRSMEVELVALLRGHEVLARREVGRTACRHARRARQLRSELRARGVLVEQEEMPDVPA